MHSEDSIRLELDKIIFKSQKFGKTSVEKYAKKVSAQTLQCFILLHAAGSLGSKMFKMWLITYLREQRNYMNTAGN